MPYVTEKQLRRYKADSEKSQRAKAEFEYKTGKIVSLIAGGIRKFELKKPEGVTDEQHNKYLEQLDFMASCLESMPVKEQ